MYKITVPEEEVILVRNIEQKWLDLFQQAKHVDRSLIKVKKKFTLVSTWPFFMCAERQQSRVLCDRGSFDCALRFSHVCMLTYLSLSALHLSCSL